MKQKPITYKEYNKKMDKVIKNSKKLPINEVLTKMLEEAAKWNIIDMTIIPLKTNKKYNKRRKDAKSNT